MSRELIDFERLAEKLKTIGHPTRIAILNLLCTCDCPMMTVKNIYETLQLRQPNTSRHLNIMLKSGVLDRIKEGGNTFTASVMTTHI